MIEIQGVSKTFGTHKVLDNLSLTVKTGETCVIIGRSGCGKSVLLKHIVGLLRPDAGKIFVDGKHVAELAGKELYDHHMKVSLVFQMGALFDSMSVAENVGFSLIEHQHLDRRTVLERVEESLGMVDLHGIGNLSPAELSGGMRKRVALARAICMRPQIILYDEPTTGVDPITADAINDLIVGLRKKLGVTSVAITHDMHSAYKISDRIAMLYKGEIQEIGTPDEIRNTTNPIVKQFITGSAVGPITAD